MAHCAERVASTLVPFILYVLQSLLLQLTCVRILYLPIPSVQQKCSGGPHPPTPLHTIQWELMVKCPWMSAVISLLIMYTLKTYLCQLATTPTLWMFLLSTVLVSQVYLSLLMSVLKPEVNATHIMKVVFTLCMFYSPTKTSTICPTALWYCLEGW